MKVRVPRIVIVPVTRTRDDSRPWIPDKDELCDVETGAKINCSPGNVGLTVPLCAFPPEAITDPYMVNKACVGSVVGDDLGKFPRIFILVAVIVKGRKINSKT